MLEVSSPCQIPHSSAVGSWGQAGGPPPALDVSGTWVLGQDRVCWAGRGIEAAAWS